jgi:PAS domain S-box-containing protein
MFILATLLLLPMLRLCRVYQLGSLADVLAFRFRSPVVGAAITIAMCLTLLPMLALQIQAVADSIHILAGDATFIGGGGGRQDGLAFLFCLIITVFAILFGTRNVSFQKRNDGLVTAIAFESLVKLVAMMVLMLVSVYTVFDGFGGLERWLSNTPAATAILDQSMRGDSARALLLVFFTGAVAMPHIFHMAFAENTDSRHLHIATWGLPLYLLLLSLPILPITWAGMYLGHSLPIDYVPLSLGLELGSASVTAAGFVAGLSAASATIIVATLALANMCLHHLVLPLPILNVDAEQDIYSQLKWLRRILITLLILGGYLFFQLISGRESLADLGLIAFTGTLQFLPAILSTLYWPGANRKGLLVGLGAGLSLWLLALLLPIFSGSEPALSTALYEEWLPNPGDRWTAVTMSTLALNATLFIIVSLLTRTSRAERVAAEICSMNDLNRPIRRTLSVSRAGEFAEKLAPALGERTARAELARALAELQFDEAESRPYALRRLRARIEANLSGLLGPAVAYNIVSRCIPFITSAEVGTEDINLIERNLDRAQAHFTGLAADLDNLRQHYRRTLYNLPIGICSLAADGEILMWNRGMQQTTGVDPRDIVGSHLDALTEPWRGVIRDFIAGDANAILKQEVCDSDGEARWISLHRAASQGDLGDSEDQTVLVEDITDFQLLEQELLHSERLASIGRLAAGVAHEIGNPITGIACLAQNLEYETDADEIRFTARDILRQTERVSRIVESLVNFSHAGSSGSEMVLVPCNLADCVDEAIHLLQLDPTARTVVFRNLCDREVLVLADNQRLLQVFVNLLGNARDASEDDDLVTVRVLATADRTDIIVEDEGCGIPAAMQAQVFEPFFTTREPGEGTGLGLALVYSIMEDMGGSVSLESPAWPGDKPGCRFTLQLPRASYPPGYQR